MAKIDVLMMDVGNVLLRLKTEKLFAALFEHCPGLEESTLREALYRDGKGAHLAYERGEVDFAAFHQDFVDRYGMTWSAAEFKAVWNDYFLPNRPMDALIGRLRGQVRLWGLSNTNAEHYTFIKRQFRVFEVFEKVIGSHQVGLRKPDLKIFEEAIRQTGVAPEKILFVDDLDRNVEAARESGMQAFHYTFNDLDLKKALLDLGFDLPPLDGRSAMAC